MMFKNYLKIALRNLWKERVFTGLNILGLTTAFATALLLGTYAYFDLSSNSSHPNSEKLFQVYSNEQTPDGTISGNSYPVPFAPALKNEVLNIEYVTRYVGGGPSFKAGDKMLRLQTTYADPDFAHMFIPPLIAGSNDALSELNGAIITRSTALKLFDTENALGKIVQIRKNNQFVPLTITGITEDLSKTSSMRFNIVVRFENLDDDRYLDNLERWDNHNHEVYVQLTDNSITSQFEDATSGFTQKNFATNISDAKRDGAVANESGTYYQLKLLPITDINFVSGATKVWTVNKTLPYAILAIGFLIIFIACVNFINMSIGKGFKRLKEVGMRKTLGASKKQLFLQLWSESLVVFIVSMLLGAGLAYLLLGTFQNLFLTRADFSILNHPLAIAFVLVLLTTVTLIAGGYPASIMSGQNTLESLKGKVAFTSHSTVRSTLMVVQFSISIALISGTLVLYGQLDYLKTQDLGFDKNQVISIPLRTNQDKAQLLDQLRNRLSSNPDVLGITAATSNIGMGIDGTSSRSYMGFEHEGREVGTHLIMVDYDYSETLGLELVAGRDFDRTRDDERSLIINESMAASLTDGNPLETIIDLDGDQFNIIGVIKDFNFQKADRAIEPLTLLSSAHSDMYYAYVKVRPGNLGGVYKELESVWNELEPQGEFMGSYLDENINRTLQKEETMTTIISSGAIVGIVLSCIGLFAMSMLLVAQRRKEIGIRKVVGASVSNVTVLLTQDFLKLVGIAFVIAAPLSYWAASKWLQNYSYHLELTVWIFGLAGLIAMVIASLTVATRTLTAATANPVDSLRSE
ncbi:MAG: ABC transporter permease [Nonlabens sp.]